MSYLVSCGSSKGVGILFVMMTGLLRSAFSMPGPKPPPDSVGTSSFISGLFFKSSSMPFPLLAPLLYDAARSAIPTPCLDCRMIKTLAIS